jgi:hypothetical protein
VSLLFYLGSPALRGMDATVRAAIAADDAAEMAAAEAARPSRSP